MTATSGKTVTLLDYGSGNLHSAERALVRAGARVTVTADPGAALSADGLVVPGVGAFAACMAGFRAVRGGRLVGERLAGGRPVLGICVGMQIMFARSVESGDAVEGCGQWPGTVERLRAPILPHMGWNTVRAAEGSRLLRGLDAETRFYFVHSYAVRGWDGGGTGAVPPLITRAEHGEPFLAAVEDGPLSATQFHPEKSGDAGAHLLRNWVGDL